MAEIFFAMILLMAGALLIQKGVGWLLGDDDDF